ncbi:MAG TPA: sensor histidine kinase [Bacteroidetes bacterium]|nr:sensor histidine kinase [Bacteroidota bacterium]
MKVSRTNTFKIFLLVAAFGFVAAMLFYSQKIITRLLDKEREVVDLYAKAFEYVSKSSSGGDLTFVLDKVIKTIDFPVILTDTQNNPIYTTNLEIDSSLSAGDSLTFLRETLAEMDEVNKPIPIAVNDTLILNYVHYGESDLIKKLRWLPYIEISIAAIFMFVAYIGFSYFKRSEQSNIWVGMAKETAHQLGTPLSSIMGWLEIMRSDAANTPKLTQTLSEIENDVDRLNKVTARFSKIGSRPDLKEENITMVIQGVMQYISRRIPKSGKTIDLALESPADLHAMINRELFEWVIENLMKNALDAMEGPTGKITFAISQSGHRTTIDVTDTGRGIDQKLHKEVFRPGYSTKKRGWGLGLSLSKRIIEDYHKGRLFVKQSAPGKGTTFRIKLVR